MSWYHHTYLGHGFAHGDAEFLLDGLELIALVIHEGRAGLLYLRCHGVLGTRYGSCGLVAWGVCYATSRTDSSRKNDNNKAIKEARTSTDEVNAGKSVVEKAALDADPERGRGFQSGPPVEYVRQLHGLVRIYIYIQRPRLLEGLSSATCRRSMVVC